MWAIHFPRHCCGDVPLRAWSGYDTTVGEPVFRTDDAFHIESGGTDSILFAHFLSFVAPSNERPSGMGMIISSREGTGRWAYGRGE